MVNLVEPHNTPGKSVLSQNKAPRGLATLVREAMRVDPFSGAMYVFRAKRADRIKLIFWDGTGLCLFAKRLEDGIFRWPRIEDGVMHLSAAQLSALLDDSC
jgi:transposase